MSETSPCCHDCSDFTDDPLLDLGCCGPIPVRRECGAPVLPVPECDEQDPTVTFDEDAETFVITAKLYDSDCSPLLDSTSSQLLSLIA